MEALNFIRLWKPSNDGYRQNRAPPCCRSKNTTTTEVPKALIASDHELDEGDDSFFDLKLPLHGFDDKGNVGGVNGEKRFEPQEEQTRSLSPNDNFSKRKILPIESSSGPQSPIALIKSAPKFRVFTLRKSKSMGNTSRTIIAERAELMETPKHDKQGSNKHFRVKFKAEDSLSDDSSKRLLKDLVQKYLNKFKPLYIKGPKKNKIKVSVGLSVSSPVSSPAFVYSVKEKQTGVRGVCKQLGKSRSTSAASSSTISRRDDSLLLQHDGIQSAILHCKKSLNSSTAESSRLSRCTSDSSQEKLSNASSTDSSLFSRVTSNSSYEKLMDSARTSSEDGSVLSTRKQYVVFNQLHRKETLDRDFFLLSLS